MSKPWQGMTYGGWFIDEADHPDNCKCPLCKESKSPDTHIPEAHGHRENDGWREQRDSYENDNPNGVRLVN